MTLVSGLFISQIGTCMYLRRSTQWEEGGLEETIGLGWDKHEQSHCFLVIVIVSRLYHEHLRRVQKTRRDQ
jgi:hypothetical protein